jgi:hypothetical protein
MKERDKQAKLADGLPKAARTSKNPAGGKQGPSKGGNLGLEATKRAAEAGEQHTRVGLGQGRGSRG